jgi:hypothetical protein
MAPNNNILLIKPGDVDRNLHPLLYEFVIDYNKFYGKFCEINSNFKKAFIFDNQSFKLGPNYVNTITQASFGPNFYNNHKDRIRTLTFENCFVQGAFRTLREFEEIGIPISPATWMRLRGSLLHAKELLTKQDIFPLNTCRSIENFMSATVKGSKRFRKIFSSQHPPVDVCAIHSVISFANLINLPVPATLEVKKTLSSWSHYCCSNQLREFIFKFRFNYLDLNNRVNAFNPEVDPRCTFCRIRDPQTRVRDSLLHSFYECPTSHRIVNTFIEKFYPLVVNEGDKMRIFWHGIIQGDAYQSIHLLIFDCVRFALYGFKKRRAVPNYLNFEGEAFFLLKTTLFAQKKTVSTLENNAVLAILLQALG